MKCFNCNGEMEKGSIVTNEGSLLYLPEDKTPGMIPTKKSIEAKGGIVLDGIYRLRGHQASVRCYCCKNCKKIVISY